MKSFKIGDKVRRRDEMYGDKVGFVETLPVREQGSAMYRMNVRFPEWIDEAAECTGFEHVPLVRVRSAYES